MRGVRLQKTLDDLPPPPEGRSGWPWTIGMPEVASNQLTGDWPRITIVTPSFNQGHFLEETIRSVLLQGYPNLEYVVIDGGSTDRSVEIIKRYAPWLAKWVSEPDGGQSDAINKGFGSCTGDLLGYINSDDIYAAGALYEVARIWIQAGRPQEALISGQVQDVSETGTRLPHVFRPSGMPSVEEWLAWGFPKTVPWGKGLHQPGCFWTAETWQRFGPFSRELNYKFDRYFFTKIAAKRSSAFISSEQLIAFFRWHARSKTGSQLKRFHEEWRIAVERLRSELSLRHRLWLRHLVWKERAWDVALWVMAESDLDVARRRLIRQLLRDPTLFFSRPIFGAARRLLFHNKERWNRLHRDLEGDCQ